ncbi:VOC family protein [Streptomyces sp. TS71-3]|uniref:VOC family protein n=1 Tax=Streptomyces sp. TS71-3 TaxID=2733862 RepID=UPI001B0407F0|nr:VOC family protein [Streptomyces sp. TS71-3]GHJ40637.1 hypothetical protein Sm713_62460 [Streptomyces sp. TS71-3]
MTEALGSTGRLGAPGHPRRTPGTPCWVSLLVHDLTTTQDFYGALFGWEFRPQPTATPLGYYAQALLDGREVAVIGQLPDERRDPVAWTPYLATDDVDLTAEMVRLCGGTVGFGPLDAGAAGRLALASDPSGAVFGIRHAPAYPGRPVSGTPGAPAWTELMTHESARVIRFYEDVFGCTHKPNVSAGPDCVTLHTADGRPVASIRGVGGPQLHGRGAHWMTYFETVDVDAAVARTTELGGSVVEPPRDGPYGRVATLTDPAGAAFALVRTPD